MDTEKILNNAGLRSTRGRTAILELLIKQGSPMSHGELLSMLDAKTDRVTLYRTLDALKRAGIVHQVQGIDGAWRFCAHDVGKGGCPGDHPHFMCLICGKMFCLTDQKMPRVNVPEGMRVDGKQFVVYGTCSSCAEQEK